MMLSFSKGYVFVILALGYTHKLVQVWLLHQQALITSFSIYSEERGLFHHTFNDLNEFDGKPLERTMGIALAVAALLDSFVITGSPKSTFEMSILKLSRCLICRDKFAEDPERELMEELPSIFGLERKLSVSFDADFNKLCFP